MRIFKQCVLFVVLALSVMDVEGSISLNRRIGVLEQRMNVIEVRVNTDIERDIEALNISLISTRDHVCSDKMQKGDRQVVKEHSAKITEVQKFSKEAGVFKGLANKKKLLREQIEIFENIIEEHKQSTNISLSNFRSELRNHGQTIHAKIDDGVMKDFNKLNASMINMKKDIDDNFRYLSSEIYNIKENVSAEIQKMNTLMLQKLSGEIQGIYTLMLQMVNSETKEIEKLIKQKLEVYDLKSDSEELNWTVSHQCPKNWTKFQSFCYLYFNEMMTYDVAKERCSSRGASVADIQSKEEGDFIFTLSTDNGNDISFLSDVWVGFTDEVSENVWISDRTGKNATYTNWRVTQPDGGTGQQCVVIGNWDPYDEWNDFECFLPRSFVCKREA